MCTPSGGVSAILADTPDHEQRRPQYGPISGMVFILAYILIGRL
jgi:hypothetical protein